MGEWDTGPRVVVTGDPWGAAVVSTVMGLSSALSGSATSLPARQGAGAACVMALEAGRTVATACQVEVLVGVHKLQIAAPSDIEAQLVDREDGLQCARPSVVAYPCHTMARTVSRKLHISPINIEVCKKYVF